MENIEQQTQPNTPDSDTKYLHMLCPEIKTMNAKQKYMFKIGVIIK
jgi:hypothetical protein